MLKEQIFASRLRAARAHKSGQLKAAGHSPYTQTRLGIDAGIASSTAGARISQYESGVHMPDINTAARFAALLDVPLAYLFCDDLDLAEMLLLAHQLQPAERKALREYLKILRNAHSSVKA